MLCMLVCKSLKEDSEEGQRGVRNRSREDGGGRESPIRFKQFRQSVSNRKSRKIESEDFHIAGLLG